jgi:hypothetical protein
MVEQDCAGVVVALGAQRLTVPGVVAGVLLATGHAAVMRACPAASAGTAAREATLLLAVNVDRVERGRGEGGRARENRRTVLLAPGIVSP